MSQLIAPYRATLSIILPFTSLITVALVSYIVYTYEYNYIPILRRILILNNPKLSSSHFVLSFGFDGVDTLATIFWLFPPMIFWCLLQIVTRDEGVVDAKMID